MNFNNIQKRDINNMIKGARIDDYNFDFENMGCIKYGNILEWNDSKLEEQVKSYKKIESDKLSHLK